MSRHSVEDVGYCQGCHVHRILGAVIALAAIAVASNAHAETFQGSVDPGGDVVFKIGPDGAVEVTDGSANDLTEAAAAAVAEVPSWLRDDLTEALRHQDVATQNKLSALVLEAPEAALVDEIGFVVAHLSPEDVAVAHLDLITKNAELVYAAAETLLYADLLEENEGEADRYTTIVYHMDGDQGPWEWTLERDDYYWWVVHPLFDDGILRRVNPTTDGFDEAPDGWFFREYLWDGPVGTPSHQLQIALRHPWEITDAALADADFGTNPSAHGVLEGFEVDPLVLVRGEGDGGAVMTAQVWGDGACCSSTWPSADGWVYATTIPVEVAAANGDTTLLENLLAAGGGNLPLRDDVLVNYAGYQNIPAGVLIVRDRVPFDLAEDPSEALLSSLGFDVTVLSSADLATFDLVVDEEVDPDPEVDGDEYVRHYPNSISKVVIASDQPYSFYSAIAGMSAKLEAFVDYGGVLEMHLATREADDWSGLRMPTGIYCSGQSNSDYLDGLETYGYPKLQDTMEGAVYLWDGEFADKDNGGDATLALPADATAMDRLGWWVEQNMPYWTGEQKTWSRKSVIRSAYAPTILWNHFGNCGELQDVSTAAGRTALLPIKPTATFADDHAINEFLFGGDWYPYMATWSDAGWYLDDYKVYFDLDTAGGGKTISGVVGMRGDGLLEDLLGRYEPEVIDEEGHIYGDYSKFVTLEVTVEDMNGAPVDGARVLIATPGFYDASALFFATWGFTGPDGVAVITVGETNDYYLQVDSPLGVLPGPGYVSAWLTEEETAEGGQIFEITMTYEDQEILTPMATSIELPDPGEEAVEITIEMEAMREVLRGQNFINERTFFEATSPGSIDLYVVDGDNLALYQEGQPFDSVVLSEQISAESLSLELPSNGSWFVVMSNLRRSVDSQTMFAQVLVGDEMPDGGTDDDTAGSADENCGCSSVGKADGASLLLLLSELLS